MTISEMMKKVETYNELSEMIGRRFESKAILVMYDDSTIIKEHFTIEKNYRKLIKETYIDACANAILNCKDYQFNTPIEFDIQGAFGDTLHMKIELSVSEE